jgi:hypothetical protein
MTSRSRTFLWQSPSAGLVSKDGQWHAAADRALGDAWGLLAPLRRAADGWEIAAEADALLDLARVPVDAPRALVPPVQAHDASHYLCMLRYDHPGDRQGGGFRFAFRPRGRSAHQHPWARDAVDEENAHDKVSARQLAAALAGLQRHFGEDFERQLVSAAEPEAPSPERGLCFAFASCQFPSGMMDRAQANASHRAIAQRFPGGARVPTRLLLLGDQVYTDATYGLLDPARLDDRYRSPYEELTGREGPLGELPQDLQRVIRMTPDDHEIRDDWEPPRTRVREDHLGRGLAAYWRYQRGEEQRAAQAKADARAPVWMQESGAGWRLFMADTRTAREFRDERSVRGASMLGVPQTQQLHDFLRRAPKDDLKIVASAAMLLPRTRLFVGEPLRQDNWQGYPASLNGLLALLCEEEARNVVFLSGDAHLACSARITVRGGGKRCTFVSHHAPALYAPFPFANESRWNLLLRDRFGFDHKGTHHEVRVAARVADARANGCGLLHARRQNGEWKIRAELLPALEDQEMRTPCSAAM